MHLQMCLKQDRGVQSISVGRFFGKPKKIDFFKNDSIVFRKKTGKPKNRKNPKNREIEDEIDSIDWLYVRHCRSHKETFRIHISVNYSI